jgi:hypothetical protein
VDIVGDEQEADVLFFIVLCQCIFMLCNIFLDERKKRREKTKERERKT